LTICSESTLLVFHYSLSLYNMIPFELHDDGVWATKVYHQCIWQHAPRCVWVMSAGCHYVCATWPPWRSAKFECILMRHHITQLTTDNNCAQLDINCIRSQQSYFHPSIYLSIHPSSWLVFSLASEIQDSRCKMRKCGIYLFN